MLKSAFVSLVFVFISAPAFGESTDVVVCPGRDIFYSVLAKGDARTLTVKCTGQPVMEFVASETSFTKRDTISYEGYTDSAALRSMSINIYYFLSHFLSSDSLRRKESLLKLFVATLLAAKTSNLTVELTYDPRAPFWGPEKRLQIIGIGIK